jgi:hypothetical protein
MKTLLDITREYVARNAALVNNPEQMIAEAHQAELRMQLRFKADPSLLTFVEHYSGALVNVQKILPLDMHPLVVRSLMAQVIAEWEEINLEFDGQLKTTPKP